MKRPLDWSWFEKLTKWPLSASVLVWTKFSFFKFMFISTVYWYGLSCGCSLTFRHKISGGNMSSNTGCALVMFVASHVHVHWLHRLITDWTSLPLILMQCDKMQSAVKRKAGIRDRKEEEVIIKYMCLCVCVCECVCARVYVFLSSFFVGDNTFWRNCLEALSPRQDTWLIFSFEPLRYIYLWPPLSLYYYS